MLLHGPIENMLFWWEKGTWTCHAPDRAAKPLLVLNRCLVLLVFSKSFSFPVCWMCFWLCYGWSKDRETGVLVPTRHLTLIIFMFCGVLHVSTHISLFFFSPLHCVPLLTATSYQNWGMSSALLFYLFHVKTVLGSVSLRHEPQHFTLCGSPSEESLEPRQSK